MTYNAENDFIVEESIRLIEFADEIGIDRASKDSLSDALSRCLKILGEEKINGQ